VSWRLSSSSKFVEGFFVHYRRKRTDRYENFETVTLLSFLADSHVVKGLEENVEYEAFVQVPILPKVTNIGLQIFVSDTFYGFVTFNKYSLLGQGFSQLF
jgi:hypothetical protein